MFGSITRLTGSMFGPIVQGAATNALPSAYYYASSNIAAKAVGAAADRYKITMPSDMLFDLGGNVQSYETAQTLDMSAASNWDTTEGTDYTNPANRAGLNFYIYAVATGFKFSANATVPEGYDADTSRKVGGCHCVCVNVGTIAGHTLTGYLAGDILPASVWSLYHRPISNPEGMVYSDLLNLWVDIYLPSGTGASTASVYGGTISDTRNWMDFVDDGKAVKKRLLWDAEFQIAMTGSNEKTQISTGADPVTTGGYVDSASRRMISNIGVEDGCGAMWQYLQDQAMNWSFVTSWGWYTLSGDKGSLYNGAGSAGTGDTKEVGGGSWDNSTNSGSRGRHLQYGRIGSATNLSARFCSRGKY